MTVLWSLLGFVVVIGILVTIHEWGHFQVARFFNIKVVRFSIGFGPALWKKQGVETEYRIALIPLGGYVKFVDEAEGPVEQADLARAFNRQSVYKRFAVVAAGPLINLVFAWLVFTAVYIIGVSGLKPIFNQPIANTALSEALPDNRQSWLVLQANQQLVHTWHELNQAILAALVDDAVNLRLQLENLQTAELAQVDLPLSSLDMNNNKQNWLSILGFQPVEIDVAPVIGHIAAEGPAAQADLQSGDLIRSIDGVSIATWQDVVNTVRSRADESVKIVVARQGQTRTTWVNLAKQKNGNEYVGYLGVGVKVDEDAMAPFIAEVRYALLPAMRLGFDKCVELTNMTVQMLKKMIMGDVGLEHLSGPVSIAQFSGQALQTGLISFLGLLGLLSLSLGILNLLPIPVLDGGHLLYYVIEMVKGSPLDERAMAIGQQIGLVLILGLTILALTNDILRITNG